MNEEWQGKKTAMEKTLKGLVPDDVQALLQLQEDLEELWTIERRIRD